MAIQAQEKPQVGQIDSKAVIPLGELDIRLAFRAYETSKLGTELFNKGKIEACYWLYRGTLMAFVPLLEHRPKLQLLVVEKLKEAEALKVEEGRSYSEVPSTRSRGWYRRKASGNAWEAKKPCGRWLTSLSSPLAGTSG